MVIIRENITLSCFEAYLSCMQFSVICLEIKNSVMKMNCICITTWGDSPIHSTSLSILKTHSNSRRLIQNDAQLSVKRNVVWNVSVAGKFGTHRNPHVSHSMRNNAQSVLIFLRNYFDIQLNLASFWNYRLYSDWRYFRTVSLNRSDLYAQLLSQALQTIERILNLIWAPHKKLRSIVNTPN